MADNGRKVIELVKVELLPEGKMSIHFGKANIALVSHALRLANLELDNIIIGKQQSEAPVIKVDPVLGQNFIEKLRRDRNGR